MKGVRALAPNEQLHLIRLSVVVVLIPYEEAEPVGRLEQRLERMGHADAPKSKRILEVNSSHKAINALAELAEKAPEDARLAAYSQLLLEEAMLAEGTPLPEPAAHAQRISDLIARDASR